MGRLSQASGNLELKWDIEPDTIALNWCEHGGPPVREPQSTGFGTRIITGSIERQLGGKTTFDWRPDGLSCVLRVPHGSRLLPVPTPLSIFRIAPHREGYPANAS